MPVLEIECAQYGLKTTMVIAGGKGQVNIDLTAFVPTCQERHGSPYECPHFSKAAEKPRLIR